MGDMHDVYTSKEIGFEGDIDTYSGSDSHSTDTMACTVLLEALDKAKGNT